MRGLRRGAPPARAARSADPQAGTSPLSHLGDAAPPSRAVLVTGCSAGIGAATARRLVHSGWTVYATARRLETISGLADEGCRTLVLDVTDEESMRRAVATVEEEERAVGILVNNAGYSLSGAIETTPLDEVRREFETNVFGLVRLVQLVLPGMRRQRWGRIVNMSSMGGRLTFPGGGFYHATKHAVEALSDVLRFEVAGFGIHVVVVEPGLIRTRFADTAVSTIADPGGNPEYAKFNEAVARATKNAYQTGLLARLSRGPEAVAEVIERAISADRPKTRYPVPPSARLLIAAQALLPDRAWDALMRTTFPRPGARA